MATFTYPTKGTCSKEIKFDLENNIVKNVKFKFGRAGNTQGIAALVEGMDADKVIELLKNIDCNGRGTSCPAQLAEALRQAKQA